MKKRNLTSLHFDKEVISKLEPSNLRKIYGGSAGGRPCNPVPLDDDIPTLGTLWSLLC